MENQKNNKGVIALLIVIIVILSALCVLLATGTISFNSNKVNENDINNSENADNNSNNEDTNGSIQNANDVGNDNNLNNYIKTTSDKVRLNVTQDYNEYAEISIEQGNFVITTSKYKVEVVNNLVKETKDESYEGVTKTFSINGEKVKYITSMYYQPGANTHVVVLTESGNVYANNIVAIDETIDALNNFKKTEYSNVQGIIKIDNSNSEANDPVPYYFGAVIDGKTVIMNFNWQ